MTDYKDFIKDKIKEAGFMSRTRIELEISDNFNTRPEPLELDKILNDITKGDYHRIKYTNKYIDGLKFRDLYFYNPKMRKKTKR